MRENFKRKLLFLLPLFIGLLIYGCVEEPTIAPVKPVYSVMRVVNLSDNVDNLSVRIDNEPLVSNLGIASASGYMDIGAGKRDFKVFNGNGDLVYQKSIEITTWERTTLVFAGFSSGSELENTFNHFLVDDGLIYVSSAPKADSLNIYFVNAAADVDTLRAQSFDISADYVTTSGDTGSVVYATSTGGVIPLAYGNVYSVGSVAPGDYTFNFAASDTAYHSTSFQTQLSAGYRYYIFLYGMPNNLQVFANEVTPPPIRSRDTEN
jgi:hypothetical protein